MCDDTGSDQAAHLLSPQDCPAYILAGGQGSRFGSDKALVDVRGQPQLVRLISQLESQRHAVEVVADAPDRYTALQRTCLVDFVPQSGPLAALATALAHRLDSHGPGWLLLIGCDQLQWLHPWWRQLADAATSANQAVVFEEGEASARRFLQPIPGIYHTSILDAAHQRLASQSHSLQGLLAAVHTTGLHARTNPRMWSFNTRQELQRLLDRSP